MKRKIPKPTPESHKLTSFSLVEGAVGVSPRETPEHRKNSAIKVVPRRNVLGVFETWGKGKVFFEVNCTFHVNFASGYLRRLFSQAF